MTNKKTKNKQIAVLGYGSQGRSLALNLRDSGYDVIIGLPAKSKSRRNARKDGFSNVLPTSEAAAIKQIVIALPDHLQGRLYKKEIEPNISDNATLIFLHGFSVHFKYIVPRSDSDIIMIAPHAPGTAVREKYLGDKSISAFYAVFQDHSHQAEKKLFTLSRAFGFQKKNMIKTTFEHEALGDLFGEQAVLCGGLSELILNGFNTLIENGLPPENAYLEVAYQLDLIIQLIKQHGIEGMYNRISVAARYGSIESGKKIIDSSVKKRMELLFDEIKKGEFAAKLNSLTEKDLQKLEKRIQKSSHPKFEEAAKKFSK